MPIWIRPPSSTFGADKDQPAVKIEYTQDARRRRGNQGIEAEHYMCYKLFRFKNVFMFCSIQQKHATGRRSHRSILGNPSLRIKRLTTCHKRSFLLLFFMVGMINTFPISPRWRNRVNVKRQTRINANKSKPSKNGSFS